MVFSLYTSILLLLLSEYSIVHTIHNAHSLLWNVGREYQVGPSHARPGQARLQHQPEGAVVLLLYYYISSCMSNNGWLPGETHENGCARRANLLLLLSNLMPVSHYSGSPKDPLRIPLEFEHTLRIP